MEDFKEEFFFKNKRKVIPYWNKSAVIFEIEDVYLC